MLVKQGLANGRCVVVTTDAAITASESLTQSDECLNKFGRYSEK